MVTLCAATALFVDCSPAWLALITAPPVVRQAQLLLHLHPPEATGMLHLSQTLPPGRPAVGGRAKGSDGMQSVRGHMVCSSQSADAFQSPATVVLPWHAYATNLTVTPQIGAQAYTCCRPQHRAQPDPPVPGRQLQLPSHLHPPRYAGRLHLPHTPPPPAVCPGRVRQGRSQ